MKKIVVIFLEILIMIVGTSCDRKIEKDVKMKNIIDKNYETAVYGGGCFWCLETLFQRLKGVVSVISGYAGGTEINPTYQRVCAGFTGHAEVIQIVFDPLVISYEKLLDIFWDMHDPTLVNRQGDDIGSQYRSIILYTSNQQKMTAETRKQKLDESHTYEKPIVTEIKELQEFFPAEDYHQNYFEQNKVQPYCNIVIAPKVKHFEEKYKELLK
jgi:peptide-methionine (S)-S-oxide reductase